MVTRLEWRLIRATREAILEMPSFPEDKLTDEQVISLKALYMGLCPETVEAMIKGQAAVAERQKELGIVGFATF